MQMLKRIIPFSLILSSKNKTSGGTNTFLWLMLKFSLEGIKATECTWYRILCEINLNCLTKRANMRKVWRVHMWYILKINTSRSPLVMDSSSTLNWRSSTFLKEENEVHCKKKTAGGALVQHLPLLAFFIREMKEFFWESKEQIRLSLQIKQVLIKVFQYIDG